MSVGSNYRDRNRDRERQNKQILSCSDLPLAYSNLHSVFDSSIRQSTREEDENTPHIALSLRLCLLYCFGCHAGVSIKTQELRILAFVTGFIANYILWLDNDVFPRPNFYDNMVSIFSFVSMASIVITIKYTEPFKSLYNLQQDSFPHWKYGVVPSALLATLALCWKGDDATTELNDTLASLIESKYNTYRWTLIFAMSLEAVTILPQLVILRKYRLVENLTGKFVLFLGLGHLLYAIEFTLQFNFVRKHDIFHVALPVYIANCVNVLLYADFFYQYFRSSRLLRLWCPRREEDPLVFELSASSERESLSKEIII